MPFRSKPPVRLLEQASHTSLPDKARRIAFAENAKTTIIVVRISSQGPEHQYEMPVMRYIGKDCRWRRGLCHVRASLCVKCARVERVQASEVDSSFIELPAAEPKRTGSPAGSGFPGVSTNQVNRAATGSPRG